MTDRIDHEALFRCSPNPYMVLDPFLNFVDANDAYLASTNTRFEDLIGRGLFDAFPGGDDNVEPIHVRQLRRSLERVLATGKTDFIALIHYPMAEETADGIVYVDRYWSATHSPILDESGKVEYIMQHAVEVTELQALKQALRRAEAELADDPQSVQIEEGVFRRAQRVQEAHASLLEEHTRLRQLIDQAPTFTAVVQGPDHVFEFANQAYYRVVGERDIIGKPIIEALPEVAGQGFITLLDDVLSTGKPFVGRGMKILLSRPGEEELVDAFVDFIYQPILDDDGKPFAIFVQGHDVTDQYKLQRNLEQLNATLEQRVSARTAEVEARNRELQEFAYVASHDLQEPLRKVHSFADIIVDEYGDQLGKQGLWYFERIQSAIKRMSLLIKDLLVYSRISTGSRSREVVDLNDVVNDVIADLQVQIDETGGRIVRRNLPSVEGDPVQLRQLFQNLISNALKYHKPGVSPEVLVTMEAGTDLNAAEDGFHEICVSDNGIGISEEFADRIFQPFQRLHSQSAFEGTGIGLAVCRRIVERHGGTIGVTPNDPTGSVFTVTLAARAAESMIA